MIEERVHRSYLLRVTFRALTSTMHLSLTFGIGQYFRFSFALGQPPTDTQVPIPHDSSIPDLLDDTEASNQPAPKRRKIRRHSKIALSGIDDVSQSTETTDRNAPDVQSLHRSLDAILKRPRPRTTADSIILRDQKLTFGDPVG